MFPVGPSVNALAIILGSIIGMMLGSKLPEKIRTAVFQCIGLCVLIIGIKMALPTKEPVVMIFSLVLGTIIGEAIDLEARFFCFADKIKAKINSKNPLFSDGFVSASVLFCVGAMAIIGSFDESLRDNTDVAFSKSMLDGFTSIALASIYGFGVLLSGVSVFIYQASLVFFAAALQPYISAELMCELTAVGGIMVIGIGLNLLNITQLRMTNFLPSLVAVILIMSFL